jgi:hypothetical protein
MTAPTYQSTTVTDFGADATTHNAVMPATVNAGDLLLALVAFDGTCTITTPSGWTLLLGAVASSDPQVGIYGKVADGTEDGTNVNFITSNSQRGSVHVIRVTAWAGVLSGVRAAIGRTAAIGSQINLSIGDTDDVLWVAAQAKSLTAVWGTAPSGYSNENKTNVSEDTTTSASIASATKTATSVFSESVVLWLDGTTGFSILVGIRATAPGGTVSGGSPVVGSVIVRAA